MSSENVDAAKVAEGAPKELASRPKEKKEKAPKPNKNAGLEVRPIPTLGFVRGEVANGLT